MPVPLLLGNPRRGKCPLWWKPSCILKATALQGQAFLGIASLLCVDFDGLEPGSSFLQQVVLDLHSVHC